MNIQNADAIIVLGRVDLHGHLTIDAHERIRYAAKLFKDGRAPVVVAPAKWWYKLTYTPPVTEAAMIQARLIEWGVPATAIMLEEESCDTLGAAYFLKTKFVAKLNWNRVIVVTSLDHKQRTQYIFHKVFGDTLLIQYVHGRRVLSDAVFEASLEREAKSLQLMENTWIGPIIPGDHDHVKRILTMHPGYNPTVTLTAEEIESRVQGQALAI